MGLHTAARSLRAKAEHVYLIAACGPHVDPPLKDHGDIEVRVRKFRGQAVGAVIQFL